MVDDEANGHVSAGLDANSFTKVARSTGTYRDEGRERTKSQLGHTT